MNEPDHALFLEGWEAWSTMHGDTPEHRAAYRAGYEAGRGAGDALANDMWAGTFRELAEDAGRWAKPLREARERTDHE
jgi:hypothetical protein